MLQRMSFRHRSIRSTVKIIIKQNKHALEDTTQFSDMSYKMLEGLTYNKVSPKTVSN